MEGVLADHILPANQCIIAQIWMESNNGRNICTCFDIIRFWLQIPYYFNKVIIRSSFEANKSVVDLCALHDSRAIHKNVNNYLPQIFSQISACQDNWKFVSKELRSIVWNSSWWSLRKDGFSNRIFLQECRTRQEILLWVGTQFRAPFCSSAIY